MITESGTKNEVERDWKRKLNDDEDEKSLNELMHDAAHHF